MSKIQNLDIMKYHQDIKNSQREPASDHLRTGKSERILSLSYVAL